MLLSRSLDCFRVPLLLSVMSVDYELLRMSVEAVAGAALKCVLCFVSLQNGIVEKLKECDAFIGGH